MFGLSFSELIVIAVIAVLFLGPEKFPETLVKIAKFIKSFKSSIDNAKTSFEQEVKLHELKEDAKKYKESLEKGVKNLNKKLTFEEFDDIKNTTKKAKESISEIGKNIENLNVNINNNISEVKDKITLKDNLKDKK